MMRIMIATYNTAVFSISINCSTSLRVQAISAAHEIRCVRSYYSRIHRRRRTLWTAGIEARKSRILMQASEQIVLRQTSSITRSSALPSQCGRPTAAKLCMDESIARRKMCFCPICTSCVTLHYYSVFYGVVLAQ